MGDPASGILWGDGTEGGPDGAAVCLDGPGSTGAQGGFELRKGLLDRREVGRVRRQIPELGAVCLDGGFGPVTVMDLEIVHDHDLVRLQCRSQPMDDVAVECGPVDRLIKEQAGAKPSDGQGGDQRPVPPAPAWHVAVGSVPAWSAAMGPGHPEVAAGLVDPDEAVRLDLTGLRPPGRPLLRVALARPPGLFFSSIRSVE